MAPNGESSESKTFSDLPSVGPAFFTGVSGVVEPNSVAALSLTQDGSLDDEPETVELFPSMFEARPPATVGPPALSRGLGGRSLVFVAEPVGVSNPSGGAESKFLATKEKKSTCFFIHFPSAKVFGTRLKKTIRLAGIGELVVPIPPDATPFTAGVAVEPTLFYVRHGASLSLMTEPTRMASDSSQPKAVPPRAKKHFTRSSDQIILPPESSWSGVDTPAN